MSYLDYFCELLKRKFINTGFVKEEEIKNYGLNNIQKNFFTDMSAKVKREYKNGDGKEFEKGDFKRIRSSAAMIFNLLGNDNVELLHNCYLPEGRYEKQFEFKYPTLKRSPRKANLDARLCKEDCEIFIESKCLEWIQNSCNGPLKKSYFNENMYFDSVTAESFIKTGNDILLSQYDSCQMFKHTLAIYNYLRDNPEKKNKKIYLVNVVWEPNETELPDEVRDVYKYQLELEHSEFNLFYKMMNPIITLIKSSLVKDFDILYLSVKEFYSILKYSDEKQEKFVQRYL